MPPPQNTIPQHKGKPSPASDTTASTPLMPATPIMSFQDLERMMNADAMKWFSTEESTQEENEDDASADILPCASATRVRAREINIVKPSSSSSSSSGAEPSHHKDAPRPNDDLNTAPLLPVRVGQVMCGRIVSVTGKQVSAEVSRVKPTDGLDSSDLSCDALSLVDAGHDPQAGGNPEPGRGHEDGSKNDYWDIYGDHDDGEPARSSKYLSDELDEQSVKNGDEDEEPFFRRTRNRQSRGPHALDSREAQVHLSILRAALSLPADTRPSRIQRVLAKNPSIMRYLLLSTIPNPNRPELKIRSSYVPVGGSFNKAAVIEALYSLSWSTSGSRGLLPMVLKDITYARDLLAQGHRGRADRELDYLRKVSSNKLRH